ncbi:MAG: YafY family transcriptional regulator [Clostridiales bacterium]|nr:YafY family transcriptional regulator [Clostridiales bacterium]
MKYQMMLKILFLLLSRKKVSAKYIADRFEISIRSVYRYIDELSLANVPIYNERGRNGGYSISESYKIPASYLTTEESEQIISALNEINKDLGSEVLHSAITKLGSISKISEVNKTISFGNLVIDASGWGVSDTYSETLKILQKAIEEKTLLSISYVDRDGITSEREFEPHVLALKQGLWYVYAYCRLRNTFRLFKVGRIQKIKTLDESFSRREILDLKAVFEKWYDEPDEDIDLIVDKSIKADVEEWLGVDKVHVSPSGKITATAKFPIDDYVTAKILSFGSKVKVESPKKLKDAVIKTAKSVEDLYR